MRQLLAGLTIGTVLGARIGHADRSARGRQLPGRGQGPSIDRTMREHAVKGTGHLPGRTPRE